MQARCPSLASGDEKAEAPRLTMARLVATEMCLKVLRDPLSREIFLRRPGSSLRDFPLVVRKLPKELSPHAHTPTPESLGGP